MRRFAAAAMAAVVMLGSALAPSAATASVCAPASQDEVDSLLEKAVSGSSVVRPQAARRLVNLGDVAADRLLERCGDGPRDMAKLGTAVVEVLGQFQDPRLRERLWQALGDVDFPWRPAAARSLATTARPEEKSRWRKQLVDPLAAVRVAALQAVEGLDLRSAQPEVRRLLEDPDDRVRRSAAVLSDRWGEPAALLLLVEDLRRDDQYFQNPTGRKARYESSRTLKEILGDIGAYQPGKSPESPENVAALEALETKVRERASNARFKIPAVAKAAGASPGDVIGLELRSCRRGEFFLRWNSNDTLRVGTGATADVALPAGTTARLQEIAASATAQLEQRTWGDPGCDLEKLYLVKADGKTVTYQVSKGPDAVEGLRPEVLEVLVRALLESLPEQGDDARIADLRARVREAVSVLGGPIES